MVSRQKVINDDSFYNFIQARTGLTLNQYQRSDVIATLDSLLEATNDTGASDFLTFLSGCSLTHPLWQRIIHVATVGETYFFRNQAQFDALRHHLLPPLIEERRRVGSKHLRLWSAGSATGEEPYSLAILLRELLPDIETWNITLLATDINEGYLEHARKGVYRSRSFRNETPEDIRERWFVPEHDSYRLKPAIRNMVIFGSLNLVSDEYPTYENSTMHMDVILCRNVTIYFDRETTRLIANRFHRALNSNGWLVVGHSEPQADLYDGFTARNFKDTVLYQKVNVEPPQPQRAYRTPVQPSDVALTRRSKNSRSVIAPSPKLPKPAAVPHSVEDFWALAKAAADLEKWGEARAWLDKAQQTSRFRPEVYYLRALVELHSGDSERASQLLRQTIYCDANFALAHYMLGELYNQQGARKEAVRHWQLAITAVENNDTQQILSYSDDLTVEMLVELLATRLSEL